MAKNFATIYGSTNDAISLEQKFFVKLESTRGELVVPANADYIFTLGGGAIEYSQPFESSPHRSGRHHRNIIKNKKETSWGFPTFFNIDTTLGAASSSEIDTGMRLLWKSLFGYEDATAGAQYKVTTPDLTFSIYENGDKFAKQSRGGFVQSCNMTFPGDGQAQAEWAGAAKDAFLVGIGKSTTDNNSGQTVTLVSGDGGQFKKAVGAKVMIIEADGTTRSADTASGTARTITAVSGDVITLDGAALADADGSGLNAPIYLCYYEPSAPAAINNPQTGLEGSFTISGLGAQCARSLSVNVTNDHELVAYCYGSDSLSGSIFVPGSRCTIEVSVEMNMNKTLLSFFHNVENFESQNLQIILGSALTRHLDIDLPKVFFSVPSFTVPETGSVPVTFTGNAYETAEGAEDEISLHFK